MKQFKTKLEQLMGDEYPEDVLEFVPMMIILDSSEILICWYFLQMLSWDIPARVGTR